MPWVAKVFTARTTRWATASAVFSRARRALKQVNVYSCVSAAFAPALASAGAYCYGEHITQVVLIQESIYFTTDVSCPNWCEVSPAWSATQQNRAYAGLLAAKLSGSGVSFYWNEQTTSCSPVEPANSVPPTVVF